MSNTNEGSPKNYNAYLLRLWRDNEVMPWRAMLENPYTGEKQGFASLPLLFSYLETQTNSSVDTPPKSSPS